MRIHLALVALSIASAAATGWAQSAGTWKWRDERGQVHVSDLPPPASVPSSAILERPQQSQRAAAPPKPAASGPAGPAGAASVPRTDAELEARRRRAVDDQLAQQKAADEKTNAIKAENCGRARSHLVALEAGERMTRTNAQGEREVLDDKARAEEMQRARSIIASDCAR